MQKIKIKQLFLAFLILAVLIFTGCIGPSDISSEVKTIEINGMFEIRSIDNREQPIKLVVTGMDCLITVSRETNLIEVILDGEHNIVRVSSFHTFNSTINDVSSEIQYYE